MVMEAVTEAVTEEVTEGKLRKKKFNTTLS